MSSRKSRATSGPLELLSDSALPTPRRIPRRWPARPSRPPPSNRRNSRLHARRHPGNSQSRSAGRARIPRRRRSSSATPITCICAPATRPFAAWAACTASWAGRAPCSPTPAASRSFRSIRSAKSPMTVSASAPTSTGVRTYPRPSTPSTFKSPSAPMSVWPLTSAPSIRLALPRRREPPPHHGLGAPLPRSLPRPQARSSLARKATRGAPTSRI